MTLCSKCLALGEIPDNDSVNHTHHPSVASLLDAAKSCSLCQHFLGLVIGVRNIEGEAQNGFWTRSLLRTTIPAKIGGSNMSSVREFVLASARIELVSEPFVMSGAGLATTRPIWYEKDLTLAIRATIIKRWLKECDSTHPHCQSGFVSSSLPGRLVDVGQEQSRQLRLVAVYESTEDLQYVALSHRWGGKIPFVTTRATLNERVNNIPLEDLPQTFYDAVLVTRTLGLRYLWIDSLCIIQDDTEDWKKEASKMASIFLGAYLTITAADAEDCHGGLGLEGVSASTLFERPSSTPGGSTRRLCLRPVQVTGCQLHATLKSSALHKRAWVFQETILSRRNVHMIKGQFFWQCHSLLESEDGTFRRTNHQPDDPENRRMLLSEYPLFNFGQLRENREDGCGWWTWVQEHCRRQLTFESDSLPSMAGIMDLYQRLTGDIPVVGLWRNNLLLHLSWRISQRVDPSQRDFSQPTWCWSSLRHSARKHICTSQIPFQSVLLSSLDKYPGSSNEIFWAASVDNVDVSWDGEPMVSQLKSAVLSIKRVSWPDPANLEQFDRLSVDMSYDSANPGEARDAIFLPLWMSCQWWDDPEEPTLLYVAFFVSCSLILEPCRGPGQFSRRVGVCFHRWTCNRPGRTATVRRLQRLPVAEVVHLV